MSCPFLSCPVLSVPYPPIDRFEWTFGLGYCIWGSIQCLNCYLQQPMCYTYGISGKTSCPILSCPSPTPPHPHRQVWMDIWDGFLHLRLNTVSQLQSPMANVLYIWHLRQDIPSCPVLSVPYPPPQTGLNGHLGWVPASEAQYCSQMFYEQIFFNKSWKSYLVCFSFNAFIRSLHNLKISFLAKMFS